MKILEVAIEIVVIHSDTCYAEYCWYGFSIWHNISVVAVNLR